jgi:hypothetical protein
MGGPVRFVGAGYPDAMGVLDARSHNEAMLVVVLRECSACGEQIRDITDEVLAGATAVLTRYRAVCQRCRNVDGYEFRLPADDPQAGHDGVVYGGAEPSTVLDAGEWLEAADRIATGGPVEPGALSPLERAGAAYAMAGAAAAVGEVLKFIPSGADAVPLQAIWTERGQAQFARDPWRMRRARLEALEAAYRSSAVRLKASSNNEPSNNEPSNNEPSNKESSNGEGEPG